MRTITLFLAVVVLAIGSGYAIAADESSSTAKGELQKFVGTWKGYQGRNVEATYTFWMEQNSLLGKVKYFKPKKQTYTEGEVSKINPSGDTLEFVIKDEDGREAAVKLELKGSTLEGTGTKVGTERAMANFRVTLKKSE